MSVRAQARSPRQGSAEWLAERRDLVTSTDLPVILGLSPFKSEATLAAEKLGAEPSPPSLRMLIGRATEPIIGAEYERVTGQPLVRYSGIVRHPQLTWAAASPDWRRKSRPLYLVEGKKSASRRFAGDEAPQDVEAQVRWAMGITGAKVADVAALLNESELRIFTIEHDDATFDNLVAIASDFRRRLAEGGPFAEDAASLKARYPQDDGTELIADVEIEQAVVELLRLRAQKAAVEEACERIETAVKSRMATATRLTGDGWSITWKRTRDSVQTDWKLLADGLLRQMPDEERAALVSLHSTAREGFRPFRLTVSGDGQGAQPMPAREGVAA